MRSATIALRGRVFHAHQHLLHDLAHGMDTSHPMNRRWSDARGR